MCKDKFDNPGMTTALSSVSCSTTLPKGFHQKNNYMLYALQQTLMNGTASVILHEE